MSNITFEVARLRTCVFKKCLEKTIFAIIFVVERVLVGINLNQCHRRWTSITSALGQCIVLSGVSGAGTESVTRLTMRQSENTVQSSNAVSMTKTVGQH